MTRKNYFPNNWQKWKDAPEELFMPHTFQEVMDWKVGAWELPSNISCLIREEHILTGKVKEYVYRSSPSAKAAAEKRVKRLMRTDDIEFTVCTPEQIHFISPFDIDDHEEENS